MRAVLPGTANTSPQSFRSNLAKHPQLHMIPKTHCPHILLSHAHRSAALSADSARCRPIATSDRMFGQWVGRVHSIRIEGVRPTDPCMTRCCPRQPRLRVMGLRAHRPCAQQNSHGAAHPRTAARLVAKRSCTKASWCLGSSMAALGRRRHLMRIVGPEFGVNDVGDVEGPNSKPSRRRLSITHVVLANCTIFMIGSRPSIIYTHMMDYVLNHCTYQ